MREFIQPKGKGIIVIPARMGSKRLPGKPLLQIGKYPLIHHVHERAKQTKADHVIVATPDKEIGRYCQAHSIAWRPTRDDHPTGTHRIEEVFRQMRSDVRIDYVINWQCDEVLLDPKEVDRLIDSMQTTSAIMTLVAAMEEQHKTDRSTTKAAMGEGGRVHWFSREPMAGARVHCGVYAFCFNTLRRLALLKPTALSRAESLEQLAWIENGFIVESLEMESLPLAVNTEEDFEKIRELMEHD